MFHQFNEGFGSIYELDFNMFRRSQCYEFIVPIGFQKIF